jgi:hypothetical protein
MARNEKIVIGLVRVRANVERNIPDVFACAATRSRRASDCNPSQMR